MSALKEYLISIVAASMVAAVATGLVGKITKSKKGIELISGLFILITVLSPLAKERFVDLTHYFYKIEIEAQEEVMIGQSAVSLELHNIITQQTEAYIQEKASAFNVDLVVSVTLSSENPPIPIAAKMEGEISPYAKSKMKSIIANDLGIPEEHQTWK